MFLRSDKRGRQSSLPVEAAPVAAAQVAANDGATDRLFVSFLWFKIDGTGKAGVRFALIVVILILATLIINTLIKVFAN